MDIANRMMSFECMEPVFGMAVGARARCCGLNNDLRMSSCVTTVIGKAVVHGRVMIWLVVNSDVTCSKELQSGSEQPPSRCQSLGDMLCEPHLGTRRE
jgi:hypothetical protein